ncbi:ABC transporter ATP-binding protein [Methylocaldum sp. BRCS4]|jgi:lipopolysaccharide transport system ATP-binding protein|uniref:ABC transporter ATP-binding protein n=1 Tax=Methylocaldum sp. GT1TLB TaxID=3438965 RepID=UPI0012EB6DA9|nr:ABC transporter ATP-binding protein [Methylocaldum sp. BRCS4]
MSFDEIAIRVSNLGKCYQIYDRPQDRLKQSIIPRLQRLVRSTPKTYFREFWALKNVSFEIKKGETVGIIGRNGSGKSTLLQMICGTLTPTCGSVEVKGRVAALLELGAGFNPEFTGRENVYMNGVVLGLSREEINERFDDIVAFAEIGDFIEQPVKIYSSGMFMRLAFAVIAHVDADILVIDEALSVGDAFFTQKCMRFLRRFQQSGTILFVSHDTGAVTNLCDRAVWMVNGSTECDGPAKEVCEQYFAARYEEERGDRFKTKASEVRVTASTSIKQEQTMSRSTIGTNIREAPKTAQVLETFGFNLESLGFGTGDATIVSVDFLDSAGAPLTWIEGGEDVKVVIRALCNRDIESPIIGFILKDRLGQPLIGDNTFLKYQANPVDVHKGEMVEACFQFTLPLLASGNYSICAAIASGTLTSHVQHHWIHDALMFTVHASTVTGVIVGIPMKSITLATVPVD